MGWIGGQSEDCYRYAQTDRASQNMFITSRNLRIYGASHFPFLIACLIKDSGSHIAENPPGTT